MCRLKKMKKVGRKHTFYTKDVLPPAAVKNVNQPEINLEEVVYDQTVTVRNCQESVKNTKKKLLVYLDQLVMSNRVEGLVILEKDFLEKVLESVKKEESDMRCQVLGQQASVDMFKVAVQNNEVEDVYLQAERDKRDALTRCLTDIVKDREILFSALENLQHLTLSNCASDDILKNLKAEYEDVASMLSCEQEKLKKFTEWQRKSGTMMK